MKLAFDGQDLIRRCLPEGHTRSFLEGFREAWRLMLLKQPRLRFGPVPDAVTEHVQSACTIELDTWLDRVLDAQSIEEVFR